MLSTSIRRVLSSTPRSSSLVNTVICRALSSSSTSSGSSSTPVVGGMPLRGVLAPVLTPVEKESLKPDMARLVDRSNWLLDNGCHGLVLFGTTGEATSFSPSQRMNTLERFSGKWSSGRGQASRRVMVGVGCASLDDTVTLTSHSVATGFPHVLMLPPYYYKNPSDDGLFNYYTTVITRVLSKGHKDLAVYLYHIPQFSGAPISLNLIQRLRAAFPANVVGIKDSTGDWNSTRAIVEANPGWGVFCGTEQVMVQTLRTGGVGCITATANLFPKPLRELYDTWESDTNGTLERKVMASTQAVRGAGMPFIPLAKAVVALQLGDSNWRRVVPPLTTIPEPIAREFAEANGLLTKKA